MGHKIRPDSLRLGIVRDWQTKWFAKKTFRTHLEEDVLIRTSLLKKLPTAGVISIHIERNAHDVRIIIKAARPGIIIGRGGKGIEELTKHVNTQLEKLHRKRGTKPSSLKITVDELRRFDVAAAFVSQNIAFDLEKRMPFRRILKKYLEEIMHNRDVQGAKIQLSGRLNGAEIARTEWLSKGKLPLQTLRADIDYFCHTAFTAYGTIGIKVWIYKGDIFN